MVKVTPVIIQKNKLRLEPEVQLAIFVGAVAKVEGMIVNETTNLVVGQIEKQVVSNVEKQGIVSAEKSPLRKQILPDNAAVARDGTNAPPQIATGTKNTSIWCYWHFC